MTPDRNQTAAPTAGSRNGATRAPRAYRGHAQLTTEQLAMLHVARRDRKLAEDEYRQLLNAAAGVTSSKDLTLAGFCKVMDRFKIIGFVPCSVSAGTPTAATPPQRFGARDGMATQAQIDLIRTLWAQWNGANGESAMNAWLEGRFGVSNIRFATVPVAQMAIEGLKAMVGRMRSASGTATKGATR